MNHIKKEMLQDCSTPEEFCFSIQCSECGRIWKSTPLKFSRAGIQPQTEGKSVVFDVIYKREKEQALQQAGKQAEQEFSKCPICQRLVCDHCFMVCEDLDMCISCARQLEEKGEPVKIRKKET